MEDMHTGVSDDESGGEFDVAEDVAQAPRTRRADVSTHTNEGNELDNSSDYGGRTKDTLGTSRAHMKESMKKNMQAALVSERRLKAELELEIKAELELELEASRCVGTEGKGATMNESDKILIRERMTEEIMKANENAKVAERVKLEAEQRAHARNETKALKARGVAEIDAEIEAEDLEAVREGLKRRKLCKLIRNWKSTQYMNGGAYGHGYHGGYNHGVQHQPQQHPPQTPHQWPQTQHPVQQSDARGFNYHGGFNNGVQQHRQQHPPQQPQQPQWQQQRDDTLLKEVQRLRVQSVLLQQQNAHNEQQSILNALKPM